MIPAAENIIEKWLEDPQPTEPELEKARTYRLRDPVHGLITFHKDNKLDQVAWRLIDTAEFQRLRRIKQLGVSEFVYPGATHTRFIHSIGVFHVARQLLDVVRRELSSTGEIIDDPEAEVAIIAALLHDIGHGPFSHTFEGVQKERGVGKKHEQWSADIIRRQDGEIFNILESFRPGIATKVADLLVLENPKNIYHAIVSSSFDADRLDYLRRDRMMTGTGAGAIDFEWLLDHVRIRKVNLDAPDGSGDADSEKIATFCIDIKALPAAEQFLLARYTLHEQVYFHKTTRCIEKMIALLLRRLSEQCIDRVDIKARTGLDPNHPLIDFLGSKEPGVPHYLALDDLVLLGALERMALASDAGISDLARRLRNRRLYKTLDCKVFHREADWQAAAAKKIDRNFDLESGRVLKDAGARLSIYTQVGGDDEKAHKKLRILEESGRTPEITSFGGIAKSLPELRLTRYYFAEAVDRTVARKIGEGK